MERWYQISLLYILRGQREATGEHRCTCEKDGWKAGSHGCVGVGFNVLFRHDPKFRSAPWRTALHPTPNEPSVNGSARSIPPLSDGTLLVSKDPGWNRSDHLQADHPMLRSGSITMDYQRTTIFPELFPEASSFNASGSWSAWKTP